MKTKSYVSISRKSCNKGRTRTALEGTSSQIPLWEFLPVTGWATWPGMAMPRSREERQNGEVMCSACSQSKVAERSNLRALTYRLMRSNSAESLRLQWGELWRLRIPHVRVGVQKSDLELFIAGNWRSSKQHQSRPNINPIIIIGYIMNVVSHGKSCHA